MKKALIPILALIGILILLGGWYVSTGNTLVTLDENVKSHWSQVENTYQRRADLIPNLVNTVKGYAKHEASVLEEVTKARSQVGQVQLNANNPQDLAKFEKAQSQLSGALSRLMVVVEKYPELKADQGFRDLQSQLEGTENRITIERQRFNESAQEFNTFQRRFPASFVAQSKGFQQRPYFAAAAGSDLAPKVEF